MMKIEQGTERARRPWKLALHVRNPMWSKRKCIPSDLSGNHIFLLRVSHNHIPSPICVKAWSGGGSSSASKRGICRAMSIIAPDAHKCISRLSFESGRRANTLAFRDPPRQTTLDRRRLIAFFSNVSYLLKQYCFSGLIFLASAALMALSAQWDVWEVPSVTEPVRKRSKRTA